MNDITRSRAALVVKSPSITIARLIVALFPFAIAGAAFGALPSDYKGKAFSDEVHGSGPANIPGILQCALYDLGGARRTACFSAPPCETRLSWALTGSNTVTNRLPAERMAKTTRSGFWTPATLRMPKLSPPAVKWGKAYIRCAQ